MKHPAAFPAMFLPLLLATGLPTTGLLTPAAFGEPGPATGQVTEQVRCSGNPAMSYALYLPSSYTEESSWPLLIVLDPRGNALSALSHFREGAERYGYILAASYDSASDTGGDETEQALRAIWTDAHRRFSVAGKRVYVAGFSGTVRVAVRMARTAPGAIAGIFGAGAGYPFGEEPKEGERFAFYGTTGRTDFNYQEMARLEKALAEAGRASRLERFDGEHSWPPPDLATRGLAWFHLIAVRDGILPLDEKAKTAVERLWKEDQYRAEEKWTAGDPSGAAGLYRSMLVDYRGIQDGQGLSNCDARLKQILTSPGYLRQRKILASLAAREARRVEKAKKIVLESIRTGHPATAEGLIITLGIEKLKKTAESDPDEERKASAGRILNEIYVQAAYYVPRDYAGPGNRRALDAIQGLAEAIRPGASPSKQLQ